MQELASQMRTMVANQERIMQENVSLNAGVAELTAQLQSQMRARQQQAEMAAALARLAELPQMFKEALRNPTTSLVDPKGLGKPSEFNNVEADFTTWKRKTENYVCGVYREAVIVMNSVVDRDNVVDMAEIKGEHIEVEDEILDEINHQLFLRLWSPLPPPLPPPFWKESTSMSSGLRCWCCGVGLADPRASA